MPVRSLLSIEAIADHENLCLALLAASRSKRHRTDQQAFVADGDRNLAELRQRILDGTVPVGRGSTFVIHDPKRRTIHAPVFAERVLHHAVMRPLGPILDRRLIHHSYACRLGKGQRAALEHATACARRCAWYLQLDVRSYFASIPHATLLDRLRRILAGDAALHLLERIIRAHTDAPGRGLPIGALTSQHLANVYLDPCDRCATEHGHCGGYVRYMDDLVVWDDDRERLGRIHADLSATAAGLGLTFKPARLNRSAHGLSFLGWRIFPAVRRLDRRGRQRLTRRWAWIDAAWASGAITETSAQERMQACIAWADHGDTRALRRRLMQTACHRIEPDDIPAGWRPLAPRPVPTA